MSAHEPSGSSTSSPPAGLSRREQILREASRLFAAHGFHGVGVDEIGAAVGISGPALYRHFAGKDAMLTELLVGISTRLRDGGQQRVAEAAEAGEPASAALEALVAGHIDFALDDRDLITLHDRELDRLPADDRRRVRQLQRQYVELWVETLRGVHPSLAPERARAAVHAVFGLLNSTRRLSRPTALPDREETAQLLHRMALAAFTEAARRG
ncbi:TetR family transcriptional regulator [Streptomyces sp. 3MP-14]|uniref:TetR family transcriptional regulator n=1 Tax=Streptomyces mimosae TaxID=2586635 RepID=A0A5N6ASU2_9ACTN|nr:MULTISPECIES: TetR/AcrR family transcriptional regulator [Streptomyces]KAB8171166.1 TetR family transcriptional regulator [Streptomyces mimosae]KAB8179482.1 TetR family transcriptional regulator [Streptomyces sp. 3MP-14]